MNSKRLLDMSPAEVLVGGASKQAGIDQHAEGSKGSEMSVTTTDSGVILACGSGSASGAVLCTFVLDEGSLRECTNQEIILNGNDLSSGREKYAHRKIMGCGGEADERNSGLTGVLTNGSPTHCLILNGQKPDRHMHSKARNPLVPDGFQETGHQVPPEERNPHPSSHIPVPRRRMWLWNLTL
ncbi:uncharacterized protein ACWYII_048178 isoform 2-T2 [Salvelinus alpinus]